MNLNYFKNQDGDYIIYRHPTCQYLDNCIFLQTIYTTFSILPKNDSNALEQLFENQIPIIMNQELDRLHLASIDDLLDIQILANFQNLDINNPIFQNQILQLENIDNLHTFYKLTFKNNMYLPISKKNVLRNPGLFIKSLGNTIFNNR